VAAKHKKKKSIASDVTKINKQTRFTIRLIYWIPDEVQPYLSVIITVEIKTQRYHLVVCLQGNK